VSFVSHSSPAQKPKNLSLFLIALGVTVALLYYGRVFFMTLVIAISIAFLLDPFVEMLMRARLPRSVASFIVCAIALLAVYLLGLGAYTQIVGIVEDLPTYSERIAELVDRAAAQLEQTERRVQELLLPKRLRRDLTPEPEPPPPPEPGVRRRRSAEPPKPVTPVIPEVRIREERTPLLAQAYHYLKGFSLTILMASFVPFLVYFMLSWKDHIRRSYLHLFEGQDRQAAGRSWEGIADMARAYIFGNFVLGIILSAASALFFWAVKLPYFLLIGPLSGFLSLIPYIGFPLAMIPPFFVALPIYDRLTPYLIIGTVVGFFHLLALNLLYPKLVGSRVHLNPLAVTVALMLFGALWGGLGLVLAIPIAAGVKAVCDNVPGLRAYGKLLGD
jgi:predicted PurR-regulated permease PerM